MSNKRKQTNLRLPPQLLVAVDELAARYQTTRNQLIVTMVAQGVEALRAPPPIPAPGDTPPRGVAADFMIVDDSPAPGVQPDSSIRTDVPGQPGVQVVAHVDEPGSWEHELDPPGARLRKVDDVALPGDTAPDEARDALNASLSRALAEVVDDRNVNEQLDAIAAVSDEAEGAQPRHLHRYSKVVGTEVHQAGVRYATYGCECGETKFDRA